VIRYPAKITYDKDDGVYLVSFPDLKGCHTYGDTLTDALEMAREALSGYLASVFERGLKLPAATRPKGTAVYLVEPDTSVQIPIMLREVRKEEGLSQEEVAARLNISYQAYQKLENPNKCNPTVKTLEKIARVFGKGLFINMDKKGYRKTA
jgi:antitoxin HicB